MLASPATLRFLCFVVFPLILILILADVLIVVLSITEALWGTRVSPSTMSELNRKIYAQIETWCNRPAWFASSKAVRLAQE